MFAEQNWNDNNGWSFADAYPDDVRVVLSTQQDALRLFTDDGSIANPFGEAATKACEAQITVEIFVPRGEGYV
ncbi:hypothetical protein EBS80_04955, partial [bacterium]|nr:hypothetical protein [bacterium]